MPDNRIVTSKTDVEERVTLPEAMPYPDGEKNSTHSHAIALFDLIRRALRSAQDAEQNVAGSWRNMNDETMRLLKKARSECERVMSGLAPDDDDNT